MLNILLLNPPGESNYLRDYYCSKTSKSDYSYTPVDFLFFGALLDKHCDLKYLDCIIDNVSSNFLLRELSKNPPDIVISLTGFVSWAEDFPLFGQIKKTFPRTMIVGSGDILLGTNLELLFNNSSLDAICYDFSSSEIVDYCLGERRQFENIAYKDSETIVARKNGGAEKSIEEISIGIPPHRLFPLNRYEYSFVRKKPFATVLTDYSCPYRCTFCIMSQLRYKYRNVPEVVEELVMLKNEGVKEIYFADQTFGAHKKNTKILLNQMIEERIDVGWVCFSRADVINEGLLALMKKAGCHTIIFGIEFGNDENLKATKKDLVISQINNGIKLCRRYGIRTVGTFLMGDENQTRADLEQLIAYSLSLNLDFASYNVYVPRVDDYLKDKQELGLAQIYDQSGGVVRSFSSRVEDSVLASYHKEAVKRFYLRPGYLLHRLLMVRSMVELRILLREGFHLFRSLYI